MKTKKFAQFLKLIVSMLCDMLVHMRCTFLIILLRTAVRDFILKTSQVTYNSWLVFNK